MSIPNLLKLLASLTKYSLSFSSNLLFSSESIINFNDFTLDPLNNKILPPNSIIDLITSKIFVAFFISGLLFIKLFDMLFCMDSIICISLFLFIF